MATADYNGVQKAAILLIVNIVAVGSSVTVWLCLK